MPGPARENLGPPEFDRFRDSYESELDRVVGWAGQDADVYSRAKAEVLLDLTRRHAGQPDELTFLDVGCGIGSIDGHLAGRVGAVEGLDVSDAMIERARAANPWVTYRTYDGGRMPFADRSVDVAFAVCVVHHLPPPARPRFFSEMTRVTRDGGIVVIAEHNPYNPITRAIVNRCAFDANAVLLGQRATRRHLAAAGLMPIETRNILFVPWRNRLVEGAERTLRRLPLGAQYATVARRSE
jgi:SAM-dependent methyltransferase